MGYFEGLADASFKQDSNGNNVFHPWGVLGKGRVLPDEAAKNKLRKFITLFYQVSFSALAITAITKMWWLMCLLLFPLILWFHFQTQRLTKNYPSVINTEKFSLKESYRLSAQNQNTLKLWLMLLISLFFVACGIFLFFKGRLFMGLGTIVFFGLCSAVFILMLKIKHKKP